MDRDSYAKEKMDEYTEKHRAAWLKKGPGYINTWAAINARKRAYKKAWHEYKEVNSSCQKI